MTARSSLTSEAKAGRPRVPLRFGLFLTALTLFVTACSSSGETLNADASLLFDSGSRIADLTPANGAEDVPSDELLQAVSRADAAGTALRVVVAAPDGEFVPASSIVDRYGGTAISYQANRSSFEGASRDMSKAQLDRAIAAARVELDIGDSAQAFVGVLEDEGIEARGRSATRTLLWIMLGLGAAFMLTGAMSYRRARAARLKRQRTFVERKQVLTDWAHQLTPELDALREPAAASPVDANQQVWHDSRQLVDQILPGLEHATKVEDLDAAEMRIGRTAMKLRDLRRSLDT